MKNNKFLVWGLVAILLALVSCSESKLQVQVELANKEFPMEIADGLTVDNLTIEGDYVVYNITVDEDVCDIGSLNRNKQQVKEDIMATLKSDASVSEFLKVCADANKGIAYKYTGDTSGDTCMITIETFEF